MKPKSIILIVLGLSCILILIYFSLNSDDKCNYKEIDIVIDTTHYGKVVFIFVEVEHLDTLKLAEVGKNLRIDYASPDPYEDYLPTSIIAYFYRSQDTLTLSDSLITTLRIDHPKISMAQKNVCYIKNGYIYRGLSKKTDNNYFIRDTLSKGSFIVPRKGIKANEVFKNL